MTPERFRIDAPITKIDDDTRTIRGYATLEAVDSQGEIMDYETAKAVIQGTWPGNIREMHKLEAVGTGVVVKCDDEHKAIEIEARISDGAPSTWAKIKDGTLKAFSIGGGARERKVEKVGDRAIKRVFLGTCTEISVVDSGSCPGTGFAIAKVDGAAVTAEADDTPITEVEKKDPPAKKDDKKKPGDKAEDEDNEETTDDEGDDPKDDKDAKKKTAPKKSATIGKARVALIAKLADLDDAALEALVRKFAPEPWDVARAANLVAQLNDLAASEMMEANAAGTGGEQVVLLRTAIGALIQFLVAEVNAQYGAMGAEDQADVASEVEALPAADESDVALARTITLAKVALAIVAAAPADLVAKAGARHSKADQNMVQGIHDHSVGLGADCGHDDTEKVQKAATDQALTTAQAALTEASATIAKLDARVKVLEDQPVGGGPITRAVTEVTKAMPGVTRAEGDDIAPEVMDRAFNELAKAATSETDRLAIARAAVARIHSRGPVTVAAPQE